MPELNVLCGIEDFSPQSEQPLTKELAVEVVASGANAGLKEAENVSRS